MVQYDKIAQEYSEMLNPTKELVLIPTFLKLIENVKGGVIDLGCGDGFFTRLIKADKVVGVDVSKELIKLAKEKSNIEFICEDVLKLKLNEKFDFVTSVYLLNYAKTKEELVKFCKVAYDLMDKGKFIGITLNPGIKVMKDFEYGRKFTNVDEGEFKDGDGVRCEMKDFEFISYYYSKKTYEECFKEVGFKVKWIEVVVPEGEYWDKFRENPSAIGFVCEK
jgi:toxoflavin synthase